MFGVICSSLWRRSEETLRSLDYLKGVIMPSKLRPRGSSWNMNGGWMGSTASSPNMVLVLGRSAVLELAMSLLKSLKIASICFKLYSKV